MTEVEGSQPGEVFGIFPGLRINPINYDRFAVERVAPKYLDKDRALFGSKWFDYRFMHPTLATSLFAHHWAETTRALRRKHFGLDQRSPDNILGMKSRTLQGTWAARQEADLYGIPYSFWCRVGIEFYLKRPGWSTKFMPSPNQLATMDAALHIYDKWIEWNHSTAFYAIDPRFRVEHFVGAQIQVEYREWLVESVGLRKNPEHMLAHLLYRNRQLDEAFIAKRFGKALLIKAQDLNHAPSC